MADVFDALVSTRPYKRAWTSKEAYEEIISQRGKQFDPKVVDVFQEHFTDFQRILEQYPESRAGASAEQLVKEAV